MRCRNDSRTPCSQFQPEWMIICLPGSRTSWLISLTFSFFEFFSRVLWVLFLLCGTKQHCTNRTLNFKANWATIFLRFPAGKFWNKKKCRDDGSFYIDGPIRGSWAGSIPFEPSSELFGHHATTEKRKRAWSTGCIENFRLISVCVHLDDISR